MILSPSLWQKHIAITQEHGSWVFLFSPLLIGLAASGRWTAASAWLIVAALAAFLVRQPLTVLVKVRSKRRGPQDVAPAVFWVAVYGLLGSIGLWGLWRHGQAQLAVLALPGLPVFLWHLILVARRAERRQIGVEIVASGVLALAAPAALWVGQGGEGVSFTNLTPAAGELGEDSGGARPFKKKDDESRDGPTTDPT